MKINLNNKLIFFIIFFSFLTFYSCFEYEIKDNIIKELNIDLSEYERECKFDSVEFFIKRVVIQDAIRSKELIHTAPPNVYFDTYVINKIDKTLRLSLLNHDKTPVFATTIGVDTIFLSEFYDDRVYYIMPKDTTSFILGFSFYDLPYTKYDNDGNNTNAILYYLKRMKFYYLPSGDISENFSDTILLKNKYCLGINSETKIYNEDMEWEIRWSLFD